MIISVRQYKKLKETLSCLGTYKLVKEPWLSERGFDVSYKFVAFYNLFDKTNMIVANEEQQEEVKFKVKLKWYQPFWLYKNI